MLNNNHSLMKGTVGIPLNNLFNARLIDVPVPIQDMDFNRFMSRSFFIFNKKKKLLEFWYVSLDRWKVIVLETLNLLLMDRENEVYFDHGQGIQIYFYIMI